MFGPAKLSAVAFVPERIVAAVALYYSSRRVASSAESRGLALRAMNCRIRCLSYY